MGWEEGCGEELSTHSNSTTNLYVEGLHTWNGILSWEEEDRRRRKGKEVAWEGGKWGGMVGGDLQQYNYNLYVEGGILSEGDRQKVRRERR